MEVYSRGASWENATGIAVGGASGATKDFIGDIGVIVRSSSVPTGDEYYEVSRAIREYHGLPAMVPMVCYGNSFGVPGNWFEDMVLPSRVVRANRSIGGMGTTQILAEIPNRFPGEDHGEEVFCALVLEGTNTLASGTAGAVVAAELFSICDYLHSQGAHVILGNVPARGDVLWSPEKETQRLICNAALAAGHALHADSFFDLTLDAELQDPNNGTYFLSDKLHFQPAGYAFFASRAQVACVSVLTSIGII